MAPKKKAEAAPADALEPGPEEEEEEGAGKASFVLAVTGVSDLPCELATLLAFTGICKENRSSPAEESSAPSGWALPKDRFIRLQNQDLYNDIVQKPMVITLRDAGAENAVIGRAELSLQPLLHEQVEVTAELELKLEPSYYQRWFPEADPEPVKGKPPPKGKEPPKPEVQEEPPPPKFTGDAPPPTKIKVSVTVADLIGPVEDRDCWTTMTMDVSGVFALPESLAALGVTGPETFEAHPVLYRGTLLGETLGEGVLVPPAEVDDNPEEVPDQEDEAAWRLRRERFKPCVRFKQSRGQIRYRGARIIQEFRHMLNTTGGVWFYFELEEKPATDPKKPNPPETADLVRDGAGRAWLDLRALIQPGVYKATSCCALEGSAGASPGQQEGRATPSSPEGQAPPFPSFVHLVLELSCDVTPAAPEDFKVHPLKLLPSREGTNQFPSSGDAALMYREAVESSFESICRDCAGGVRGGVPGAVSRLKEVGSYDELKNGLRSAMIRVFRERLQKDTTAIPGKPLRGAKRDEFISGTYTYLQLTVAEVLDELRKEQPGWSLRPGGGGHEEPPGRSGAEEGGNRPASGRPISGVPGRAISRTNSATRPGHQLSGSRRPSKNSSDEPAEGRAAIGGNKEAAVLSTVSVLAESIAARKAREALGVASEAASRCSRLAYEAELVGNFDRAAELLQNRFLLEGTDIKLDPQEWVAFAKFCARSRGRQAAAEEALRQAVRLLAEGNRPADKEVAQEVDLFLACLLLDRGRGEEAMAVFQSWHEKDFANGTFRFLIGLALHLSCDFEQSKPYLESVGKPRTWFQGLPDHEAVVDKLRAFRGSDGPLDPAPYAAILEKLLSFGLPELVFSFLDQTGTLPPEVLACEQLVLMDAKASALDRDFAAAAQRLEPILASGSASREAWRLAGECSLQVQDFDRALQALQQALAFENKFDDPAIYIRLGSVLLVKKRWKHAREAFLRSIQSQPTAEAWSGVAYAEYRSEELNTSYEALCEANVLDNERADVWAQLCLVHLRFENWDTADHCCRQCLSHQPECEELLLEAASEYSRRERQMSLAEACARRALQLRDSGQGHSVLADVLAQDGQAEESVLEAQIALKMLPDQPDLRKAIFAKALRLCEEMNDAPLLESLHAVQKFADDQFSTSKT